MCKTFQWIIKPQLSSDFDFHRFEWDKNGFFSDFLNKILIFHQDGRIICWQKIRFPFKNNGNWNLLYSISNHLVQFSILHEKQARLHTNNLWQIHVKRVWFLIFFNWLAQRISSSINHTIICPWTLMNYFLSKRIAWISITLRIRSDISNKY